MSYSSPQQIIPVLGFAAYSGTGKTTLLTQLIPELKHQGLRIAAVKRTHHDFEIDTPGKDSYELRKAGSMQTMLVGARRWVLVSELDQSQPDLSFKDAMVNIDPARIDLILVEGFKHENHPKIELHREACGKPYLYPEDSTIIALATDQCQHKPQRDIVLLNLNDVGQISAFVMRFATRHKA